MADLLLLPPPRKRKAAAGRCCAPPSGRPSPRRSPIPTVIEVMVNPDGRLWIERATDGRRDTGERIGSAEAERIIRLVAAHVRREVHDKAPIVSAELPETGERFEGVMPPVAPAPCFAVRKPADVLYPARRLRGGAHHVGAPGRGAGAQRARAQEHPGGRRHVLGQDHAGQRPAGRDRRSRRARRHPGGHARAQVRRRRLRGAAHQARRRHPGRPGALDAAAATRPHHRRRGARPRSPRHAEGLEHRPSRRHHHRARQLGAGRPPIAWSSWCRRPSSPCRAT